MSATPALKIYNSIGVYIAACKHAEDAAAVVAMNGDGATIRDGHSTRDIVWREGSEAKPASESYDFVANIIAERIECRRETQAMIFANRAKAAV